jgi:hypothetical protein
MAYSPNASSSTVRLHQGTQREELETVVTILDDDGEKYLHDFFMHPAAPADQPVPLRPSMFAAHLDLDARRNQGSIAPERPCMS